PAAMSGTGQCVDARVLGLRCGGLLLGTRHLGSAARCRASVDPRLLGVRGPAVPLECRVLGTARRLLRRDVTVIWFIRECSGLSSISANLIFEASLNLSLEPSL